MRNPLSVATALLALSAAGVGAAIAQTPVPPPPPPFSVRGPASDLPALTSPTRPQGLAQNAAAAMVPPIPQADPAPFPTDPRGEFSQGPRPFDVNGDGRSPSTALPNDLPTYAATPATTISPLGGGRAPALGVPVDATSADQRGNLTRLLDRPGGEVRELRVAVDPSSDWVDSLVARPVVPFRTLRLEGETESRAWTVFLSAAEAARGGTLSIAFNNSVLVLPEASRLRVFLNGRQIAQTAIDSPDRTKVIALPVPSDLLRPGENAIRLEADMRHRIDCSLGATYELWTQVDPRLTGFSFGGGRVPVTNLADLGAVGVGVDGATRLRIVQAQPATPTDEARMLRAVQAAALRGRFVQPLVEIVDGADPVAAAPGTLTIAIGTAAELRRMVPNLPARAGTAATAEIVDSALGPTVVLTGPSERDVDAALARFDAPVAGASAPQSATQATPPWLVPNSVRITGPQTVTLREAGVETAEFTGRRFRRAFQVTLPPDFYAAAYGEALLSLDFAYAADVEPGSSLQVFVNGVQSTAIMLTSASGDTVDDVPVALGMQAFRPGINTIELVAELNTASDRACLPGGSAPTRERFALFSTSTLTFPNFARIGQLPNLAAFATNGFPYTGGPPSDPVRVRIAGTAAETVGAAGTLLARVAVSRGAALRTEVVDAVAPYAADGVIVVGAVGDLDSQTLDATGVSGVMPSTWLQPVPGAAGGGGPTGLQQYDEQLRRAREQLRSAGTPGVPLPLDGAAEGAAFPLDEQNEAQSRERWFEEVEDDGGIGGALWDAWARLLARLDLAAGSDDGAFDPPVSDAATLILAQAPAPSSDATAWTLVTAPTPGLLATSMAALSAPEVWTRIGGRITAFERDNGRVTVVPAGRVSYLATVPLSFSNLRLIAANWFSINNGFYALALILVGTLLGVLTAALVRPLGRHN